MMGKWWNPKDAGVLPANLMTMAVAKDIMNGRNITKTVKDPHPKSPLMKCSAPEYKHLKSLICRNHNEEIKKCEKSWLHHGSSLNKGQRPNLGQTIDY